MEYNKIITSQGNVQFTNSKGRTIEMHPMHCYAVYENDTVSFLFINMKEYSGQAFFASQFEDVEVNGETYDSIDALKDAITEAFAKAGAQARTEVVETLPSTGLTNTIYLVPKSEGVGYDEYIYTEDGQWELIGDTDIELDRYLQKADFNVYSASTDEYIGSVSGNTVQNATDIASISGSLDTEISAREAADSIISGAVDNVSASLSNEVSRATSAETALGGRIDTVNGRVDAEQTARATADNALSGAIDSVISDLASEVSARTDAITAVEGQISSLGDSLSAYSTSAEVTAEINAAVSGKADASDVYTKAEVDGAISAATSGKVNTSSVVTAVTSGSTDSEIPTAKAVYNAIPTGGSSTFDENYLVLEKHSLIRSVEFTPLTSFTENSVYVKPYEGYDECAITIAVDDIGDGYVNLYLTGSTVYSLNGGESAVLDYVNIQRDNGYFKITQIDFSKNVILNNNSNSEFYFAPYIIESGSTEDAIKQAAQKPLDESIKYSNNFVAQIDSFQLDNEDLRLYYSNGNNSQYNHSIDNFLTKDGEIYNNYGLKVKPIVNSGTTTWSTILEVPDGKYYDDGYTFPSFIDSTYKKFRVYYNSGVTFDDGEEMQLTYHYIGGDTYTYFYYDGNQDTFVTENQDFTCTKQNYYLEFEYIGNDASLRWDYVILLGRSFVSDSLYRIDVYGKQLLNLQEAYESVSTSGGGKAIEAGRGISITTGETADTVSFNLPISGGTGTNSIAEGVGTVASGNRSHAEGYNTTASGNTSHAEGYQTVANGDYGSHAEGWNAHANGSISHAEGYNTTASGDTSHAEGNQTVANGNTSHAEGKGTTANGNTSHAEGNNTTASGNISHAEGIRTIANNEAEHASGSYNVSNKANTTWGDSGNTLFSVGNGTADNARHNAFEIRQNGDIYLTKDGQDVKLQDQLGGGKAIEAGRGITVTTGETADTVSFNLPISATSSDGGLIFNIIDGNSKNNAGGQLASAFGVSNKANGRASFVIGASNTVTGEYSFAGGDYSEARGNESFAFGYLAKAIGNFSIAFGSYFPLANNEAEVAIGKANVSNTGSTDADKTLFSVGNGTNNNNRHNAFEIRQNGDIYCSDGTNDVKLQDTITATAANTTALGGLKLVKLSQSDYNALTTKDDNTVYFIGDSNGYTMKIGDVSVN